MKTKIYIIEHQPNGNLKIAHRDYNLKNAKKILTILTRQHPDNDYILIT